MAQKITYWLLIALVLSLGLGQLLRFEYGGVAINLHDLLIVPILVLNLNLLVSRKTWQVPGISLIYLGLFIGWLSAYMNYPLSTLGTPALYLLRLTSYLALFLVTSRSNIQLPRQVFLMAGLTTLGIGLAQYLLLPDMRIFQYLGWDDHLNRLTLPHFDPTYTGAMLVLLLILLAKQEQVLVWITVFATILTYSRSILLSFLAAQIIVLKNVAYLLLVLAFAVYVTYIHPRGFGEGTNLLRTYSIASRFGRDYQVMREAGGKLVFGTGYNTLALNNQITEKGYPNHAVGPNSSYLTILVTSGIIGLVGWLTFIYYLYLSSAQKAAIVFVAFASLFNNVLLYPFVMLWIFLLPTLQKKNAKVPSAASSS